MFKTLHFDNPDKLWFGSDFHFGHDKDFIWKARGFSSVVDHDNQILDAINSTIPEDGSLIYLGDFSHRSSTGYVGSILRQIKCKIYYIWGNHEKEIFALYRAAANMIAPGVEVYPVQWLNVQFIGTSACIRVQDQEICLSHYAHLYWNKSHYGSWMLCGHAHGNCPQANVGTDLGHVLDCGVDNALRLVHQPVFSYAQIAQIFNSVQTITVPLS